MSEVADKKWQPSLSVYMGEKEESARRLQALDSIATAYGIKKSELIRRIADGRLVVIAPPPHMMPHQPE